MFRTIEYRMMHYRIMQNVALTQEIQLAQAQPEQFCLLQFCSKKNITTKRDQTALQRRQ